MGFPESHSPTNQPPEYILTVTPHLESEVSIFHDRWEGPFLRYVTEHLGLPFDATDREISALMQADLEARDTTVIHGFDN